MIVKVKIDFHSDDANTERMKKKCVTTQQQKCKVQKLMARTCIGCVLEEDMDRNPEYDGYDGENSEDEEDDNDKNNDTIQETATGGVAIVEITHPTQI